MSRNVRLQVSRVRKTYNPRPQLCQRSFAEMSKVCLCLSALFTRGMWDVVFISFLWVLWLEIKWCSVALCFCHIVDVVYHYHGSCLVRKKSCPLFEICWLMKKEGGWERQHDVCPSAAATKTSFEISIHASHLLYCWAFRVRLSCSSKWNQTKTLLWAPNRPQAYWNLYKFDLIHRLP